MVVCGIVTSDYNLVALPRDRVSSSSVWRRDALIPACFLTDLGSVCTVWPHGGALSLDAAERIYRKVGSNYEEKYESNCCRERTALDAFHVVTTGNGGFDLEGLAFDDHRA